MHRHWHEIADDMRKEKNQERLAELIRELDDALIAEETKGRRILRFRGRVFIEGEEPPKQ